MLRNRVFFFLFFSFALFLFVPNFLSILRDYLKMLKVETFRKGLAWFLTYSSFFEACFTESVVLRQPCPFPGFRLDLPLLWELPQGGELFFRFNAVTPYKVIKWKLQQLEKGFSSKKLFYVFLTIFIKFLLFFHGIVAIFEINL